MNSESLNNSTPPDARLAIPVTDLHIHPSMSQQIFKRDVRLTHAFTYAWDLQPAQASFPKMKTGGYGVFFSVLHVPEKGLLDDFPILNIMRLLHPNIWRDLIQRDPFETVNAMMDDIEKAASKSLPDSRVQPAHSVKELKQILALPEKERPMAMVHAIEGAHALGWFETPDDEVLARLQKLFDRGVAYLTLSHFYPNVVASPTYPFPYMISRLSRMLHGFGEMRIWRDLTLPLTNLGVKVVDRMMDLGMLIDLSHSNPVERRQIIDMAKTKIHAGKRVTLLMSHVGVYAVNPSPYNPTDEEIRMIAQNGGVLGVIFMNYWLSPAESKQTLDAIAQTIDHLVQVGGEDCVGLGTDFDGFATLPEDLPDASKMTRLIERLISMGYSEERVRKVMGGNALRVLLEGWGKLE